MVLHQNHPTFYYEALGDFYLQMYEIFSVPGSLQPFWKILLKLIKDYYL